MHLISIIGPTAVGKTAISIKLAKYFNACILSADSRQFYKEISIGTAKPNDDELTSIPHYFINNKSITDTYSAGDFERDALQKLDELFLHNNIVFLVGGSGLYVKALWEGLHQMPKADENLRQYLTSLFETKGIQALQQLLKKQDPSRFDTIDKQNPQRLMRALEIASNTSNDYKDIIAKRSFKNIKIGLNCDREVLYKTINNRVENMLNNGLLLECKNVYEYRNNYALQTVGYTEIFDFFEQKHSIEKATELIKQHTRNYAKRQITWFKRDDEITWFNPIDYEQILQHIITLLKE